MTELRIDAGKAERIITQILREKRVYLQSMQSPWLQVFVGGLRRRCRRARHWIAIGSFRESLQMATISRLQWPKGSLKGRVSFGTRANFGSLFTIKVAIFGRTSHGPSSLIFSVAEWSGIARHRPAQW